MKNKKIQTFPKKILIFYSKPYFATTQIQIKSFFTSTLDSGMIKMMKFSLIVNKADAISNFVWEKCSHHESILVSSLRGNFEIGFFRKVFMLASHWLQKKTEYIPRSILNIWLKGGQGWKCAKQYVHTLRTLKFSLLRYVLIKKRVYMDKCEKIHFELI